MLDRDLTTAETPEALSELSVLIADRLTLFEAATIAGELPAPPKITRVEVKAIENELVGFLFLLFIRKLLMISTNMHMLSHNTNSS